MNRNGWIGIVSLAVMAIALAALAWLAREEPGLGTPQQRGQQGDHRVLDAAPVVTDEIATVELDAARVQGGQPHGSVSSSELIARFEREPLAPEWSAAASARLRAWLETAIRAGGELDTLECRSTLCRVRIGFPDPTRRMQGVSALLHELQQAGGPARQAVIEHLGATHATFLIEPS